MHNRTVPPSKALSRRKSTQYRLDIDPKAHASFIQNVSQGVSFKSACRDAGLMPKSVMQWLEKGEILEDEEWPEHTAAGNYVRFFRDFEAAKAQYEKMHSVNVNANAMGFVKTRPDVSQWALKTYYPERYNDKFKIQQEASRQLNELLSYLMGNMTDDCAGELMSLLAGIQGFKVDPATSKLKVDAT